MWLSRWFNVKDKNVIKAFARHCQSIYSQQTKTTAAAAVAAHSFPDDKIFRPDWFHIVAVTVVAEAAPVCAVTIAVAVAVAVGVVSLQIRRGGKR